MQSKHLHHYVSLTLLLVAGLIGVLATSSAKNIQMAFVVLTTIFYVGWGILHHAVNHDITTKIVVEYVLMGSLGMAVILFILQASF